MFFGGVLFYFLPVRWRQCEQGPQSWGNKGRLARGCQVSVHQLLEHHRGSGAPSSFAGDQAVRVQTQGPQGLAARPESDPGPRPPPLLPRVLAQRVPDGLRPAAARDDLHGVRQLAGHPQTEHHQEAHPSEAPGLSVVEHGRQRGHPLGVGESPEHGGRQQAVQPGDVVNSGRKGANGAGASHSRYVYRRFTFKKKIHKGTMVTRAKYLKQRKVESFNDVLPVERGKEFFEVPPVFFLLRLSWKHEAPPVGLKRTREHEQN